MTDHEQDGTRLADEIAAQCIRENDRPPATATIAGGTRAARTPWIVVGVSVLVMLAQIPSLRASLAEKPSIHNGVVDVDPETEACIDTLWAMSALVQEGESADAIARLPFTEPVTRKAYRMMRENDQIAIECPN